MFNISYVNNLFYFTFLFILKKEEIGEIGMIPKVSCYNQNFSAAGLASSRAFASGVRTMSHQAERAVSRVNQQRHHTFLSDEACTGSLFGAAAALIITLLTKSGPAAYGVLHFISMGSGFFGGKVVEHYRSTIR